MQSLCIFDRGTAPRVAEKPCSFCCAPKRTHVRGPNQHQAAISQAAASSHYHQSQLLLSEPGSFNQPGAAVKQSAGVLLGTFIARDSVLPCPSVPLLVFLNPFSLIV